MLNGYYEAEITAARVASAKMGFFTSPAGDGYVGEDVQDEYTPIMSAEPATFEQLPAGMDFKAFDPAHPTTAFESFQHSYSEKHRVRFEYFIPFNLKRSF